jgi:glutamate dehydrogenase
LKLTDLNIISANQQLLRLVHASLAISEFDQTKLGPNGIVHLADNEEGIKARNSMHNRLVADAFVPAGGRPSTIDMSNYRNFLLPDGSPSSRLIVEGANLFITGEARKALYDEAALSLSKIHLRTRAESLHRRLKFALQCY